MSGRSWAPATVVVVAVLGLFGAGVPVVSAPATVAHRPEVAGPTSGPVANFTAAINRLVELVGLAGGGILALVWARVALSWFSNDVTKKIQAKDRARDALVGTLLFVAAVTGLVYGLAHWVVTGS
jgi:uncharacterized BrkB/YihY/UPF0761 family membrane protein